MPFLRSARVRGPSLAVVPHRCGLARCSPPAAALRQAGRRRVEQQPQRRGLDGLPPPKTTVGFIMVGSNKDDGYNEAVYDGSQTVAKDMTERQGHHRRQHPRDQRGHPDHAVDGRQGREGHLRDAATATSPTRWPSRRPTRTSSCCTRVASTRTRSRRTSAPTGARPSSRCRSVAWRPARRRRPNKLGYVYAFPINQTIANIDAFELGAQIDQPEGADLPGQHLELV